MATRRTPCGQDVGWQEGITTTDGAWCFSLQRQLQITGLAVRPLERTFGSEHAQPDVVFGACGRLRDGKSAARAIVECQQGVDFGSESRSDTGRTRIGLIGSVQVRAARIAIAAPQWSQAPHTMLALDASLTLGYANLWRAWRGEALHIRALEAGDLDLRLERKADGRATWQFGKTLTATPSSKPTTLPSFGTLRVRSGYLRLADAVAPAEIDARFALSDGQDIGLPSPADAASTTASAASPSDPQAPHAAGGITVRAGGKATGSDAASALPVTLAPGETGIKLTATGSYRTLPVRIDLRTLGVHALLVAGKDAVAQPLQLLASIDRSELSFNGSITDPLRFAGLRGKFSLAGPSLAAAGDPLGITLPATPAFRVQGMLVKDTNLWKGDIDDARIGSSQLSGAFAYDTHRKVPLLAVRLGGTRLLLSDLGPAVGVPVAGDGTSRKAKGPGRVIPDRAFDLASLRTMDADVLVDIAELDTGTEVLAQLRPLRAHLLLADGVLTLSDIEAQTAKGQLLGHLQFDGRGKQAKWTADLRLLSVDLAQWLQLERGQNKPPYLSGKLDAQVVVAGSGRSSAEILANLSGDMRMHVREAAISHLARRSCRDRSGAGARHCHQGRRRLAHPVQCRRLQYRQWRGPPEGVRRQHTRLDYLARRHRVAAHRGTRCPRRCLAEGLQSAEPANACACARHIQQPCSHTGSRQAGRQGRCSRIARSAQSVGRDHPLHRSGSR